MLIGGREPASITIAEYDATWPVRFAELRGRVERALPNHCAARRARRQHVGTRTGRGARLDMLRTVASVDDEATHAGPLLRADVVWRVRDEVVLQRAAGRPRPPAAVELATSCATIVVRTGTTHIAGAVGDRASR